MLRIDIVLDEIFNEETNEFEITSKTIELEHSLVSLSKWESQYEKPFLDKKEKTSEEVLGYIRHMCIDDVSDEILMKMSQKNVDEINEYINAKMSATWFSETKGKNSLNREAVTSELIYYWMTALSIPMECQYWHLNRLFTLIKVSNIKNSKPEKRSRRDILEENMRRNEERLRQYETKG